MKYKVRFCLLLLMVMMFSQELTATENIGWLINYGKKTGMVSFYNANSDKNFREDAAYGPLSFKVIKDKLWLLDSIGGRLLVFGADKKLQKSVRIPNLSGNAILEDFAVVRGENGTPQAIWVAEADSRTVRKISLATKKEILRIGGKKGYKFTQIHQIEVDASGRLYVGDYGTAKLSIFTPYGKLIREIPWQLSDFSVDQFGHLYTLHYTKSAGYFLRVYFANGSLARNVHIGLPDLKNARILSITNSGGVLVVFIPASGFHGKLKLLEVSRFGSIGRITDIIPTLPMNRFAYCDGKNIWNMRADYNKAPKGNVQIQKIDWMKK